VRNPSFHHASGEETPRYFYLVRLPGMASEARLPVYWNPRPASRDVLVREAYRVRVAGQTLEAGNLHVLRDLVRSALAGLGAPGQPPRFWLLHRSSAVPVYWQGGTYEALTDGPRVWGRDLQELRDRYAYYLASCNGGRGGPVTVALLSFADLDVHGPEAVLEGPGVWAPVFPEDGTLVAFGPGQTTWSAPHSPAGVLSLWEAASRQLALCGKLADPASLWLAEVSEGCHGALIRPAHPRGLPFGSSGWTEPGQAGCACPSGSWATWCSPAAQSGAACTWHRTLGPCGRRWHATWRRPGRWRGRPSWPWRNPRARHLGPPGPRPV